VAGPCERNAGVRFVWAELGGVRGSINVFARDFRAQGISGRHYRADGGGTTTLFNVCGIERASAGALSFLPRRYTRPSPDRIANVSDPDLPAGAELFRHLTVLEMSKSSAICIPAAACPSHALMP